MATGVTEDPPESGDIRTYRDMFRWVYFAMCVGGAAAVAIPAMATPVFGVPMKVFWVIVSAAGLWLGFRLARATVTTDPEGIHVSNIFAARSFRWEDIDAFTVGRWKLEASTGIVELKDGTRFGMLALKVIRPLILPQPVDAEDKLDELKEQLEAHRATAPASSG